MNIKDKFIKNEKDFIECQNLVSQAFDIHKRLPEKVFRENYGTFLFDETNWFDWETFQNSALNTKEQLIIVMSLEQEPKNKKHFESFGYYSAFRLANTAPAEVYNQLISFEQINEETQELSWFRGSNIVVWVPESLDWAVWQSYDLELSIIGFNKEISKCKTPYPKDWWPVPGQWVSVESAIAKILPPVFSSLDDKVLATVSERLKANYNI